MEQLDQPNDTVSDKVIPEKNMIFLISSLVLGLLFNYLFYAKIFGVSYPIFIVAFYVVFFWYCKSVIDYSMNMGWLLTIPVLLLSSTYMIFSNVLFFVLNFLGIPLLLIIQTTILTKNNIFKWYDFRFIADIFFSMFVKVFSAVFKPFSLLTGLIAEQRNIKKHSQVLKIMLGILISVPLLLIVVALLSSADEVFGHFVNKLPDFLVKISFGEFIFRCIIVVFISLLSFSYIFNLSHKKWNVPYEIKDNEKISKGFWDPIIVFTVLAIMNAIYLLFTVIQFSYLFGGLSDSLPSGLTYSAYARKGFFELVVVTVINLGVLLLCINLTKKNEKSSSKIAGVFYSLLIVFTIVMLFSAHFRMSLYEDTYGYTYLRVLTHAFMAFLAVLLLATLIKVWYERMSLLKYYIVISIVSYVILNYANVDLMIARNNINSYHKPSGRIDTSYLTCLSYDATPKLIELLDAKDPQVAQDIENCLYQQKSSLKKQDAWQSFNFSKARAEKLLSKIHLKYKATKHSDLYMD